MLTDTYINYEEIISYTHKNNTESVHWDYHFHEEFEIYILLEGRTDYFIGKTRYNLLPGDVVVINNKEIHTHSLKSKGKYNRVLLSFNPAAAQMLSSKDYDLLRCFCSRHPGERNKISLSAFQLEELLGIINRFDNIVNSPEPSSKLLRTAYFTELLVLINKAFEENKAVEYDHNISDKLLPVLNYINENIEENLSLDSLQDRFFINKYHLSRLFKDNTGLTIHKYITLKRVINAKALLEKGLEVLEVCHRSGYNDYTNFIKMFTSVVGITPAKYRQKYIKLK